MVMIQMPNESCTDKINLRRQCQQNGKLKFINLLETPFNFINLRKYVQDPRKI